jgi:hypothetical protein
VAYCPLYEHREKVNHLKSEGVCLYLRECAKPGGLEKVAAVLPAHLSTLVIDAYQALITARRGPASGAGDIHRSLMKAATSPSKIASGKGLHK